MFVLYLVFVVFLGSIQERSFVSTDFIDPLHEESSNSTDKDADVDPLQLDSDLSISTDSARPQTNLDIMNVFSLSEDDSCFDDLTAEEVSTLSDTTTKQNLQVCNRRAIILFGFLMVVS